MLHLLLHFWPLLAFSLPLVFLWRDSFDHYNTVTDKYDVANGGTIVTTPVRTGVGGLGIIGAFGPQQTLPTHPSDVVIASAYYSNQVGLVYALSNEGIGALEEGSCVTLSVASDLSLLCVRGNNFGSNNGGTLGQSLPGLVVLNTFNLIGLRAQISTNALVQVWLNGVLVINVAGVDTTNHLFPARLYFDNFQLLSPGGLPTCVHDDLYVLDCGAAPYQTYLGALRIYAEPPVANAAPLAWTPLASTNWVEVSENPPDGDTSYNSDGVVGDTDQYVYDATSVPAGAAILSVGHDLDMRVDSGLRSVASVLNNGPAENPKALSNNYHIYQTQYDTPPAFPANFGPKVTA
jgi:hypothetical protein